MQDQAINCHDCHEDFVWPVKDQEFYAAQGYKNPPKRCKPCREKRKARQNSQQ